MSKFSSFVELLIKQTCRRASHEFEIAKTKGKLTSDDPTNIYSLEFLKSLHDKPRDNIFKLLKASAKTQNVIKTSNGLNWLNSNEFTEVERKILLDFLIKVKDMSPSRSQKWIDLQHYMHYVYRNFANANPDPSAEVVSPFFLGQMRELVKSLLEEDESQLYLRILALLREYCIFAQWNYSKYEGDHSITRLFYYYEAMLSAAKHLSSVFSEFEITIYRNYSVCWIDFNTCVFIRFFFETEFVQNKIYHCLETRVSPGDTPAMFGLLEDLKNLWIKENKRVRKITRKAAIDEHVDYFFIEEAMINSHKKVLTSNFWVERPQKDKDDLDLSRLDHHIFRLLQDPFFHPAGPILDRNGQCICEECLIAKYKCILDSDGDQLNILKNVSRLTFCRICSNLVDLELFQQHINGHSDIINKNKSQIDLVKLGNGTIWSDNMIDQLNEDRQPFDKNPDPMLASEPPIIKTTCDIHYSNLNRDKTDIDIECTKLAFEQFLKARKIPASSKDDPLFNKSVRSYLKIKKDLFKEKGKVFNNYLKQQAAPALNSSKICETHTENDRKNRELRKTVHKHDKPYSSTCKSSVTPKSNCEHSCKHEEETNHSICQGHGGTCDHHRESKKCDCTYCEVFGTNIVTHAHKNNELRDRLRIRLHQRREKRTKDTVKSIPANPNGTNSVKVKTVVSKVEERVPLPSSPTNIPPAPVVKSSESSSLASSGTDDIHGLVNYIEGNSGLNKMELAQKKAAKKARQRQKKEEERRKAEEEQKRLVEEMKRKEAEKKKELAKKQAEKEAMNKTQAQSIKSESKKAKKEKQREAERREKENGKSNIVEETIPAMVTIKRVAENGSSPTVTITLKGSTPDQDKLLYTLVGGPEENAVAATAAGQKMEHKSSNEHHTSNKKKKHKQKNNPPPTPAVVTKELKVTVALDTNKSQESKKNKNASKNSDSKKYTSSASSNNKPKETKQELNADDLPIPMLRLPPGITITKVEGPVSNRNYPIGNIEEQKGSTINVGKSGVIVVDTEKLIQNKQQPASTDPKLKTSKKNKRKKNKKLNETQASSSNSNQNSKKMITLKNPIFQTFQPKSEPVPVDKSNDNCAPAAIFTNENGMVTIRSSRLQQSLSNSSGNNSIPIMSLSNLLPETQKPKTTSDVYVPPPSTIEENTDISPFNAQEILSGLPGIEITKVDKKTIKPESEVNKSCQTAQVSIIPASNGADKFNFDQDDWLYDSVFTPRDVLEDDMDAEELELEAFKRFCQQSVPPKRKEKVAHLNVADIVLAKKTDNYV